MLNGAARPAQQAASFSSFALSVASLFSTLSSRRNHENLLGTAARVMVAAVLLISRLLLILSCINPALRFPLSNSPLITSPLSLLPLFHLLPLLPPPRPPHYRWTPEKADWPYFRELLDGGSTRILRQLAELRDLGASDQQQRQQVINDMWRVFRDWVFAAAVPAVGRKKCGRVNRERWHRRVPGVKEANLAYHKANRRHCRLSPERRTAESHAALVAARSHYRRTVALAKQKVWDDLCARIERSGNSKDFWSNFRSTVGSPSLPVSSVHHAKDPLPLNPTAARDSLARHFADACSPFPHTPASARNTEHISVWQRGLRDTESDPRTDNTPISVATVKDFCKKARRSAAVGADQFSPHFLAEGSVSFFTAFTIIVNYSWDHAVLPSDWRVANVCALFKGGNADPSSPDSFRPISNT